MKRKYGLTSVCILLALSACGGGGSSATPVPVPHAGAIALPASGQTSCFNAAGTTVACAASGQDGELKTGVAAPGVRFVADGSGSCITDNLTGLMWSKDANLPTGLKTWQQALDQANSLDLCGFTDWRLPNRLELRSLINHSVANNATALNALGFSNVQADAYWSSSSMAGGGAPNAFVVYMKIGGVGTSDKSGTSAYVWSVRAGR